MSTDPIDTIEAFLADMGHGGFGTLTTSADGTEAIVTFKPDQGEAFRAFARRVMTYAAGEPIEWHMQGRQIPLARVRRRLN
jgi:hypothetical protein